MAFSRCRTTSSTLFRSLWRRLGMSQVQRLKRLSLASSLRRRFDNRSGPGLPLERLENWLEARPSPKSRCLRTTYARCSSLRSSSETDAQGALPRRIEAAACRREESTSASSVSLKDASSPEYGTSSCLSNTACRGLHRSTPVRRRPRNMTPYRPPRNDVDYRHLVDNELPKIIQKLGLGPAAVLALNPQQAGPTEQAKKAYLSWLAAEYHGTMEYMARPDRIERCLNYERILPGVRAIIVTSLFYWPGKSGFPSPMNATSSDRGTVSCYAWGEDYHQVLGRKLKQLAEQVHAYAGGQGRYYVDTGALLERHIGEQAGLGFVGKNSLLIHPRLGSGFFLGEVLTTLPLPNKRPEVAGRGGCGRCRKCLTACPTEAIVQDRVVDARRCISYLTIELQGPIPLEFREPMGSMIYGCDICQRVCPWNQFDWQGRFESPLFGAVPRNVAEPDLLALIDLNEPTFQQIYASSPIRRIGLERLQRNAMVALGNVGSVERARPRLCRLVEETASDLLREHAQWAIKRIDQRQQQQQQPIGAPSLQVAGDAQRSPLESSASMINPASPFDTQNNTK